MRENKIGSGIATSLTGYDFLGIPSTFYHLTGKKQKALDIKVQALYKTSKIQPFDINPFSPTSFTSFYLQSVPGVVGTLVVGGYAFTGTKIGTGLAYVSTKFPTAMAVVTNLGKGAIIGYGAGITYKGYKEDRLGEALGRMNFSMPGNFQYNALDIISQGQDLIDKTVEEVKAQSPNSSFFIMAR